MINTENKHWTDYISCIGGIIAILPIIGAGCYKLYQWFISPSLIYGDFDYPTSTSAHYYLLIKSFGHDEEYNVKVTLKPKIGKGLTAADYKISIRNFLTTIGSEHMQEINVKMEDRVGSKVIEFSLPANVLYRMVIEGTSGSSGSLLHMGYLLQVECQNLIIKFRPLKLPYMKYIRLNLE